MGKLGEAVSTTFILVLALSACTPESGTNRVSTTKSAEQTLRIAAAANLSDVLPDIIDDYQADNNVAGQPVEVTYASSGKLYAQIKAGAPYDVFLSANQAFPAKLAKEMTVNMTDQNNVTYRPFTYAQGQLALYSVTRSLEGFDPTTLNDLLMSSPHSKITIANPKLAPYGASAQAYLQAQNLYDDLTEQKRVIKAENIGQAFQYAHTGSVDYGLVAQSQLTAIQATPEQFMTLPPASYPAILQDGIVISDQAGAVAFTDYLRSTAGRQHFMQAGYLSIQ
jgi:molybdate transport system substrate-binding protein